MSASGTATSSASSPLVSGLRTCLCPCSIRPRHQPPRMTTTSKATSRPVRNWASKGSGGAT
jgi:hypothetical protein